MALRQLGAHAFPRAGGRDCWPGLNGAEDRRLCPPGNVESGAPRHLDVEEAEVGLLAADGFERVTAIGTFADEREVRLVLERIPNAHPGLG
jgi:hypothetical protein